MKNDRPKRRMRREDPMVTLLESMVAGSSSSAILNQEARGSVQMAIADQLPTKGLADLRPMLEAAGGKIGDPTKGDEMFTDVTLPPGWKKRQTDHSMWTDLVDAKGHKRAAIFYKAAFYDRDAFMHGCRRFTAGSDCDDYQAPREERTIFPCIKDGNQIVWRGKVRKDVTKPYPEPSARDHCDKEASELLLRLYPDASKMDAYWDLEKPEFPPSLSEGPKGELYKFHVTIYRVRESDYDFVDAGAHCERKFTSDKAAVKWWDTYLKRSHLTNYDKIVVAITQDNRKVDTITVTLRSPAHSPRFCRRDGWGGLFDPPYGR